MAKPAKELKRLPTPYTENVDKSCPLPAYPRPQWRGETKHYHNLNGPWRYAITKGTLPDAVRLMPDNKPAWQGEILVPFSPETLLSGVERTVLPGDVLWYERDFKIAIEPERRYLLHFGAVDQDCAVYVNDHRVDNNEGGYWSFACDITDHLKPNQESQTIHVAVIDDSQLGLGAYGKQTTERGKIWYAPTSGIWQTVWLESVGDVFAEHVKTNVDIDEEIVTLQLTLNGQTSETVPVEGQIHEGNVNFTIVERTANTIILQATLRNCQRWSPESPYLYDYTINIGDDTYQGYFAMRAFGIGQDKNGHPKLLLNGQPYVHVGVLDQGYWSDGYYTAPTDEAMIDDIETMKALGFNMIRKHIKIEPMRWYYHCDRLGMLVWQDMVSGGHPYHFLVIGLLPFINIHLKDDRHYGWYGRKKKATRERFAKELERTIEQLQGVPSLCLWVPFNEGWGQFAARYFHERIKKLDPTRLIDHASGYHDQGIGDLKSRHIYFKPVRPRADKHGRPYALTEFGGFSYAVAGHTASDAAYGYKPYRSLAAYQDGVLDLLTTLADHKPEIIAATVYTQLSDVEDETNGILTFDRQVSKWPLGSSAAKALSRVNERLKKGN